MKEWGQIFGWDDDGCDSKTFGTSLEDRKAGRWRGQGRAMGSLGFCTRLCSKSWGNGEKHEALKALAMQGLGAPRDGAAVQRRLLKAP